MITLVQTQKSRRIPIILVHRPFWQGLLDWFANTLVQEGTISPEDIDLMQVLDTPEEVVNAIFEHYEARGFEPTTREREQQMSL
jgi:predicted Rossmann-fold nucleotide-binding protein